jgi:hypothetical protein
VAEIEGIRVETRKRRGGFEKNLLLLEAEAPPE